MKQRDRPPLVRAVRFFQAEPGRVEGWRVLAAAVHAHAFVTARFGLDREDHAVAVVATRAFHHLEGGVTPVVFAAAAVAARLPIREVAALVIGRPHQLTWRRSVVRGRAGEPAAPLLPAALAAAPPLPACAGVPAVPAVPPLATGNGRSRSPQHDLRLAGANAQQRQQGHERRAEHALRPFLARFEAQRASGLFGKAPTRKTRQVLACQRRGVGRTA